MIGAILMKTVPAMIMTSASRGVPLITSAPNRATSNLGVILVAISTKQHESPKWKGHREFFLPQASRSCTVVSMMLCFMVSSMELLPLTVCSFGLLSHQFMRDRLYFSGFRLYFFRLHRCSVGRFNYFRFVQFLVCFQNAAAIGAEVERAVAPFVDEDDEEQDDEHHDACVAVPAQFLKCDCPAHDEYCLNVEDDEQHGDE